MVKTGRFQGNLKILVKSTKVEIEGSLCFCLVYKAVIGFKLWFQRLFSTILTGYCASENYPTPHYYFFHFFKYILPRHFNEQNCEFSSRQNFMVKITLSIPTEDLCH